MEGNDSVLLSGGALDWQLILQFGLLFSMRKTLVLRGEEV